MTEKDLLDWAEFVATKFSSSRDGWKYTRSTGDLKHIRYASDSTGYNSFWSRLKRAFDPEMHFKNRTFTTPSLSWSWAWIRVSLTKDKNMPDGFVNGGSIITFWEEDGEYITLFGPTVGKLVIDFVRAEPENEHAQKIVAEMTRLAEMSWPEEKEDA